MKPLDPQDAPTLLGMPLLSGSQAKFLPRVDVDSLRLVRRVAIICERDGKLVGDIYDIANPQATNTSEMYASCGAIAVVSVKTEPHEVIVLLEQPGAPDRVPCACKRDGLDQLPLATMLRATEHQRAGQGHARSRPELGRPMLLRINQGPRDRRPMARGGVGTPASEGRTS